MTEEKSYYQSYIIGQILSSPFDKALQIYEENLPILENVNFIFPHLDGIDYLKKFNDRQIKDIDIIHFFSSDTLLCLNAEYFLANAVGFEHTLHIENLIALDTQIQSYLYRNYIDQKNSIPDNISEVLKLIYKRNWLVDCMAYTMENALFNPEYLDSQIYKDNSIAFETYFFRRKLKAKNYSKKLINQIKKIFDSDYANWFRRQYKLHYLALLVMSDLYLNHKSLSVQEKEETIIKYFHERIGIVSDREMNLAKLLFQYGTKIKFFGKIQKNRNDIISNLQNMAWDIFHLHNTLNNLSQQTTDAADFTIPFFVTYDRRLHDIIPLYKIKNAAFIKNTTMKHINYLTDIIDPTIKQEYFTAKSFIERHEKVKNLSEVDLIIRIQAEINKYENLLK